MFDFTLISGTQLDEQFCGETIPEKKIKFDFDVKVSKSVDSMFAEEFNPVPRRESRPANLVTISESISESDTIPIVTQPEVEVPEIIIPPVINYPGYHDTTIRVSKSVDSMFTEEFIPKSVVLKQKNLQSLKENTDKFISKIIKTPKVEIDMSSVHSRLKVLDRADEHIEVDNIVTPEPVVETHSERLTEDVSAFITAKEKQLQDQLLKIRQDFVSLQSQMNQKIARATMMISSVAGGGEVNLLRLDDVDTSNLNSNKTYMKYNPSSQKIEFVSAAEIGQAISVTDEDVQTFIVDPTIVTNQYITLQSDIATGTEEFTELDHNGISQDYGLTFQLVVGYSNRLDISELGVVDGDHIRVRWKKA